MFVCFFLCWFVEENAPTFLFSLECKIHVFIRYAIRANACIISSAINFTYSKQMYNTEMIFAKWKHFGRSKLHLSLSSSIWTANVAVIIAILCETSASPQIHGEKWNSTPTFKFTIIVKQKKRKFYECEKKLKSCTHGNADTAKKLEQQM